MASDLLGIGIGRSFKQTKHDDAHHAIFARPAAPNAGAEQPSHVGGRHAGRVGYQKRGIQVGLNVFKGIFGPGSRPFGDKSARTRPRGDHAARLQFLIDRNRRHRRNIACLCQFAHRRKPRSRRELPASNAILDQPLELHAKRHRQAAVESGGKTAKENNFQHLFHTTGTKCADLMPQRSNCLAIRKICRETVDAVRYTVLAS